MMESNSNPVLHTRNIDTDFIRLDAFLKLCGAFVTGGQAKMAIQGGKVLVNGTECRMRGKKLVPGDLAEYGGNRYKVGRV